MKEISYNNQEAIKNNNDPIIFFHYIYFVIGIGVVFVIFLAGVWTGSSFLAVIGAPIYILGFVLCHYLLFTFNRRGTDIFPIFTIILLLFLVLFSAEAFFGLYLGYGFYVIFSILAIHLSITAFLSNRIYLYVCSHALLSLWKKIIYTMSLLILGIGVSWFNILLISHYINTVIGSEIVKSLVLKEYSEKINTEVSYLGDDLLYSKKENPVGVWFQYSFKLAEPINLNSKEFNSLEEFLSGQDGIWPYIAPGNPEWIASNDPSRVLVPIFIKIDPPPATFFERDIKYTITLYTMPRYFGLKNGSSNHTEKNYFIISDKVIDWNDNVCFEDYYINNAPPTKAHKYELNILNYNSNHEINYNLPSAGEITFTTFNKYDVRSLFEGSLKEDLEICPKRQY